MNARTWNLKLMATDEHPETTIEGVPHEHAAKILRGLIHGPDSIEYAYVQDAVDGRNGVGVGADRHEGPLAA